MDTTRVIWLYSLLCCLCLAVNSTHTVIEQHSPKSTVLVLGAQGLIGSTVSAHLKLANYTVVEVLNRRHVDLRNETMFREYMADRKIDFAFFLACEVGGSKYLQNSSQNVQKDIIENNILIYQTLLPYFEENSIPFLFTSSSYESRATPYGSIKRLGEQWIDNLQVGKSVRLWNVFGFEPIDHKSRVVSDWIYSCLTKGEIKSLTSGHEYRQFMYVKDCALALIRMMEMYEELELVTDLSSFEWSTMRDIGDLVTSISPVPCNIEYDDTPAQLDMPEAPQTSVFFERSEWTPVWKLDVAIEELYEIYIDRYSLRSTIESNRIVSSMIIEASAELSSGV